MMLPREQTPLNHQLLDKTLTSTSMLSSTIMLMFQECSSMLNLLPKEPQPQLPSTATISRQTKQRPTTMVTNLFKKKHGLYLHLLHTVYIKSLLNSTTQQAKTHTSANLLNSQSATEHHLRNDKIYYGRQVLLSAFDQIFIYFLKQ